MWGTEALVNDGKKTSNIHWIFMAVVLFESVISYAYFPGWAFPVVTTTIPLAFAALCSQKVIGAPRNIAYWLFVSTFTMLFWALNARLRIWMNHVGILSVLILGVPESIGAMAVVVRLFPEAKKR